MELTQETPTEYHLKKLLSTTDLSVALQPQFKDKNCNVGGKIIFEDIKNSGFQIMAGLEWEL